MLDRRQGRGLRVEVTPDAADLLADGRHQAQHLFVGAAGARRRTARSPRDGLGREWGRRRRRSGRLTASRRRQTLAALSQLDRHPPDPGPRPVQPGPRRAAGRADARDTSSTTSARIHLVVCRSRFGQPQQTLFVWPPSTPASGRWSWVEIPPAGSRRWPPRVPDSSICGTLSVERNPFGALWSRRDSLISGSRARRCHVRQSSSRPEEVSVARWMCPLGRGT